MNILVANLLMKAARYRVLLQVSLLIDKRMGRGEKEEEKGKVKVRGMRAQIYCIDFAHALCRVLYDILVEANTAVSHCP